MNELPLLISIPHGGSLVPPEVAARIDIETIDIFEDSDGYTTEIYGIEGHVRHVIKADVARAFVDLNRAEDDLPPANPDGVIKSHTSYRKKIYKPGREPGSELVQELLEKYYRPYHARIAELVGKPDQGIQLALDCHSMAAVGPDISPDPGRRRPAFCLGDRHGHACDPATTEALADSLRREFGLPEDEVSINRPFAGGYITRTYGSQPLPWIQVEMSRELYLGQEHFDKETLAVDRDHLERVREKFLRALHSFLEGPAS